MNFLDAAAWKRLHLKRLGRGYVRRGGAALAGLRKHASGPVEKLDDRTLRFTVSTGAVDRDMDTVAPGGWDLAAFEKNPVVLWSHRADDPPIGKAIDFGADERRLFSAVRFLPDGYGKASEIADTIYRMASDGWLAATSVGFRPVKWDFTTDVERGAEDWFPGIDYQRQELVEFSIVSVPSNPEALIEAPIEPGGDDQGSANVIVPAPVQLVGYDPDRRKRRARAAMLGVF
jgi:HK97 family phage prohead protease